MGRTLLLALLLIVSLSIFYVPWVAGIAYVANSLMQPQYIWPWIFDGIPIFRITAAFAILSFMIAFMQKKLDLSIYKEKQNILLMVLWLWMHLSNWLSPYKGTWASVSPELVLSTLNSIMIMYFVLLPLCNNEKAIKYLCYVFIGCGLYYTYWANNAYLSQEWYRFVQGRLTGPVGSPYRDANTLSTLIVMTLPILVLQYFRTKSRLIKLSIILAVPLAWHALILFSSRGALLATIITLLPTALVVKSKKFNAILITSFSLFLVYQGSLLLNRTTDTIELAATNVDEPINPRLVSWEAGLKLIPIYPLFGAGVQRFEAATRNHFPNMTPHVAHNTFLNFAANTGLPTGLIFLILIFTSVKRYFTVISKEIELSNVNYFATVSSSISLMGFFICSIFLDLIIFEPMYFALLLNLLSWLKIDRNYNDRFKRKPVEKNSATEN